MRELQKETKKLVSIGLTITMLVPLLAACTTGGKANDKEERVLRIATTEGYNGEDEYFRDQFTDIFEFNNPNIKLEIISVRDDSEKINMYYGGGNDQEPKTFKDPIESLQELIEGPNPPDLIATSYDQMSLLLEKNLLAPLDSKIAEDKFDTTDYVPVVYEGIKNLSPDGKLYALAPLFSSPALVYNKKIFADAGVEPPTDNMTWDEIFTLAQRVSKPDAEKPLYGFSFTPQRWGDPFEELSIYTNPLELRYFDEVGEKMTVDTPEWEKVWTKLYQLQNDKVTPPVREDYSMDDENQGPFSHDRFMSGKLAMTIMHYGQLEQINEANKAASSIKNYTPIDFDVVTVPSHPQNPGVVPGVHISGLMGISSKATNAEDAWKLLKFINSPEWAKIKAGGSYELSTRKSYIKPQDGATFNIEAFYNIKPSSFSGDNYYKLYREKPNLRQALQPGRTELHEVLQGNKTVKEGLQSWQSQGDNVLQQIKANPNGPIVPPNEAQGVPAG
jgi:multiple sugar transport system substrate-binding protein